MGLALRNVLPLHWRQEWQEWRLAQGGHACHQRWQLYFELALAVHHRAPTHALHVPHLPADTSSDAVMAELVAEEEAAQRRKAQREAKRKVGADGMV